jgi:NACalpha-BTF3-like transcription factor
MGRRKITEEAQEQAQDESDESSGTERTQLTQRMPNDLLDDVDEVANRLGMSRNAAINMLVEQGLDEF